MVLEEEIDPNYVPGEEEVVEYAKWLGMDLVKDEDLYWIAREGLMVKCIVYYPAKPYCLYNDWFMGYVMLLGCAGTSTEELEAMQDKRNRWNILF